MEAMVRRTGGEHQVMYTDMKRPTASDTLHAIDLRSDTVTRPDAAMRAAMAEAVVGDDVYGEDPTVNRLEAAVAELLGKPAAVFLSSGTQSNLAAVLAHCARGEEIVVGDAYHIYRDEAAGASVLGGVALFPIPTQVDGSLDPQDIADAVKPDDPHCTVTRLLAIENTVGGRPVPLATMQAMVQTARDAGLSVHLDGARLMNAATALELAPACLAETADSVSLCLSKGLGAPVGSVLAGEAAFIARARRHRKILGGAMRQAGVLAAAGLHALAHNRARLVDDHHRAEMLQAALAHLPATAPVRRETNMVYFSPAPEAHGPLIAFLAERGIVVGGQKPAMRLVLHRDIDDTALDAAIAGFRAFYGAAATG